MFAALLIFPLSVSLASFFLYRHAGKKQLLRFDLVQFLYAFIITPLMFIWMKSLLFFVVRKEVGLSLSLRDLFIVDTTFSLVFLFAYAFIVVHSVTKSFELKRLADPLYDLFMDSEHLHLWVSHIVVYAAGLILLTLISGFNLLYPLDVEISKTNFWIILAAGSATGWFLYIAVWMSNFDDRFVELMQLLFGLFFLVHAVSYLLLEVHFVAQFAPYWFVLMTSASTVCASLIIERSNRGKQFLSKFHYKGDNYSSDNPHPSLLRGFLKKLKG